MYISGIRISTVMIGSMRAGLHSRTPCLRAMDAAILNESSFESTAWNEPSYRVALKSLSG